MKLLLAALALAAVGIVGSRVGFRARRGPLGVRLFLSSGSHFVLLGFLLGPRVAGVFDESLFRDLAPFLALGLGWIGLLVGLQFHPRTLGAFRTRTHVAGIVLTAAAFAVLASVAAGLAAATGRGGDPTVPLLLAAAAAGCVSSPTGTAVVFGSTRVAGPTSRFLSLVSSLDAGIGFAALAVVLALFHPPLAVGGGSLRWAAVSLLVGLFLGWLFLSLTRVKPPREELILFLIGLALVAAGTNLTLAASALFAAAVTGAFIANGSPAWRRAYALMLEWEKPIHIVFLLLAGSLLAFPSWHVLPLVAGYVVLRGLGKLAGGALAAPLLPEESGRHPALGAGLLSQGGVSIAMAVSVYLALFPTPGSRPALDYFFAAVVLGVMINELAGPPILRRWLVAIGEAGGAGPPRAARGADPAS